MPAKKKETISAHARKPVMRNEPLALPIHQTSTYRFPSVAMLEEYLNGNQELYLYTRYENPTLRSLQEKIAELEGGESCFVFSSGMAAITSSILSVVSSGDEVLASDALYGRTLFFMERWLPRFGVRTRLIPHVEFPEIDSYFTPATKIVYVETPTNPTLRIINLSATAEKVHRKGALLFLDNTFATSMNQQPFDLGVDFVLHSLTKYMGGHSDVVGGAAIFPKKYEDKVKEALRTFGGIMDPFAAFLVDRGIRTMPLRVERQNKTALFLARKCEEHPQIVRVHYPGLGSHPQHDIASRQMSGFGGMFSFDLRSYEDARSFVDSLQTIAHAASLGGVETIISIPVLSSHYGQPDENLKAAGISRGTVRVSVGLEAPEDLWQDMEQSLSGLASS